MERDERTYLYDIILSCQNILVFTADLNFPAYQSNALVKSAVERQFILIGEALNNLKRVDVNAYNKISFAGQIVGFRNILVHGYESISDQLVWEIVGTHVKELQKTCESLSE